MDDCQTDQCPLAHLHPCVLFATLRPASRAIRKGPATEQETVPGAAVTKHPDVQKAAGFLKLPSLRACKFATYR